MSFFTLANIRADVQARGYGTDTVAQQTALAQSVLRRLWTQRRWPFLEGSSTAGVTVGSDTVQLSISAGTVDAVRMRTPTGTEYYDLEYMPHVALQELAYKYRTPDRPRYWTMARQGDGSAPLSIRVYPTPDRAYTLDVDTTLYPGAIPADDFSAIPAPDQWRDIVVYGVCAEMAARQRDWNAVNYWRDQYQTTLTEYARTAGIKQRQNASEVARWDGWEDVDR